MKKSLAARAVAARWALPLAMLGAAMGAGAAHATGAAPQEAASKPAAKAGVAFRKATAGVTPFISFAKFGGNGIARTSSVSYYIAQPKGAHAKPVQVRYSIDWLRAHGRIAEDGTLTLPVFGLYANRANDVTFQFGFTDGTTQDLPVTITTAPYSDPRGVYDSPQLVQPRDPGVALGYSYMYIKSSLGTPIIIDTDAQIRWVGTGIDNSFSSAFTDNGFVIGSHDFPAVFRLELDGTWTAAAIRGTTIEHFNHNIAPGRDAMLAGVDTMVDGVENVQSNVIEVTANGDILHTWDFSQIIGDYMTAQGDDAGAFVRPGHNWLHINSQIYDPTDDTLIISSREQFVMKLGYDSHEIVWILGDPSKYWYTFASLRAKAVTLSAAGAYYPIGQHDISLTADHQLMLFNNGAPTNDVPPGAPIGKGRPFSAVDAYRINAKQMTAVETLRYTHEKTLRSPVCSSSEESLLDDGSRTLLIDYASADNDTRMHLVGLGANGQMAFEYVYGTRDCGTGWNARPIPFEAMSFD